MPSRYVTRFAATERYGGLGNDSGGASIAASADSMNDFQISAGNVPPTTGAAVELGAHRHELVRVADPDRGHELRRVADEPRVAVVLGRPGLAGDRLGPDSAAAVPVPDVTTPSSICVSSSSSADESTRFGTGAFVVDDVARLTSLIVGDRARLVAEDAAVDAVAAVRERRVRARHLERVHRPRAPSPIAK